MAAAGNNMDLPVDADLPVDLPAAAVAAAMSVATGKGSLGVPGVQQVRPGCAKCFLGVASVGTPTSGTLTTMNS